MITCRVPICRPSASAPIMPQLLSHIVLYRVVLLCETCSNFIVDPIPLLRPCQCSYALRFENNHGHLSPVVIKEASRNKYCHGHPRRKVYHPPSALYRIWFGRPAAICWQSAPPNHCYITFASAPQDRIHDIPPGIWDRST